jgi:hypothetical protein
MALRATDRNATGDERRDGGPGKAASDPVEQPGCARMGASTSLARHAAGRDAPNT